MGRYVVLETVGQGGMGVMLTAFDPQLDRNVAIKLLHRAAGPRRGSSQPPPMLQQAQALARLTHPNVVAVHDVGVHEGRVFIAMQLVPGTTVLQWVERARPTWRETLAQFVDAGRGLSAAHAAGLVHGQFEPGNVLIGEDGRVRVTEFGLASVSDEHRAVGYSAPEQRAGGAADPRSDQFSFCVALYEAVYGKRPHASCDPREPAIESATATSAARTGRAVPKWVRQGLLRGLSCNPSDRFTSMDALLAHLGADPFRPWRRVGWAVVPPLIAATIWMVAGRDRDDCVEGQEALAGVWDAGRKASIARRFRETGVPYADATWRTLAARLDALSDAWVQAQRSACEARERGAPIGLVPRGACLHRRFEELRAYSDVLTRADAALVERAVSTVEALGTVADCYDAGGVGSPGPPEAQRRIAGALARARVLGESGRYDAAVAAAAAGRSEALEVGDRWLAAEATFELGRVQEAAGHQEASQRTYYDAFSAGIAARHDEVVVRAALSVAALAAERDEDLAEAANWLEHAQGARDRMGPAGAAFDGPLHNARGRLLHQRGEFAAARDAFSLALERSAFVAGQDARTGAAVRASYHVNLGYALANLEQFGRAVQQMRHALELEEHHYGRQHPNVAATLSALCALHSRAGRPDDAVQACARSVAILRDTVGEQHPRTATALTDWGAANMAAGRPEAAQRTLTAALASASAVWGEGHPRTGLVLTHLSVIYERSGKLAQAERYTRRALAALGDAHPDASVVAVNLANLLSQQGRYEDAEASLRTAIDGLQGRLGADHADVARAVGTLGQTFVDRERFEDALPYLERSLAGLESSGAAPLDTAAARYALGAAAYEAGEDRERAVALVRSAVRLMRDAAAPAERIADVDAWLARH